MGQYQKISRVKFIYSICLLVLLAGCAAVATHQLDQRFGTPAVVERTAMQSEPSQLPDNTPEYFRDVKPIADKRCVVCHGCYDAPCQLKMSSFASIDRGASKEKVYNGYRLVAGNMTRMSVDAGTTQQWRDEGFFPVLNEREQIPQANREGSLLYRMLELKQLHPLPGVDVLPDSFDFSLNREQSCAKIEEFENYRNEHPLGGMPYGLPALANEEQQVLMSWAATGGRAIFPGIEPGRHPLEVDRWEAFFNGKSLKQQLVSRYIYEHLFLANLYFDISAEDVGETRQFYKLVRSRSAPGKAIDVIATRRPFDDPGGEFYYRLQRVQSTVLAKQHMPYRLDEKRMQRWQDLFFSTAYEVSHLPGYDPEEASNPFVSFAQLPLKSRYQFMLDEAQFTIMGFIKGPVCRGQVALNVINDQFWVLFIDPEYMDSKAAQFLQQQKTNLRLPAEEASSTLLPLATWLELSAGEKQYLEAKKQHLLTRFDQGFRLTLDTLWDGDGSNRNAALTIFRHFDSATVVKGLVGDTPKTAWIFGYPLLERVHYLLVAGFDVFGNVSHQLLTRLYMDFLRMEGEYHFLLYLPKEAATQEVEFWYRDKESNVEAFLDALHARDYEVTGIDYQTQQPKKEFFNRVKQAFGEAVIAPDPINPTPHASEVKPYQKLLQDLAAVKGMPLEYLPEQSLMRLRLSEGGVRLISLIRNRAHSNVAQLFNEKDRFIPEEQTLTVAEGIIGAYPNAFFDVAEEDLERFVSGVAKLASEQSYGQLLGQFGIRRTNPQFWEFSDAVHALYFQRAPIDSGFLDYNRLENR